MPCNDYNANQGRTKIINKGVIKLDAKKKRKRKEIQQHRKKNQLANSSRGFVYKKKGLKL